MPNDFEARGRHVRIPLEIRAEEADVVVEGYAAVFEEEADIGGYFREKIARGAFTDAIGRDDVIFCYNHNDDTVMARSRAGTLDLSEDERGLRIVARLSPDDPDTIRLVSKMRHGSISKMSFAFYAETEEWDDLDEDKPLRTIKRAALHDVSAVTKPAYDGTEIGRRNLANVRKERGRANRAMAAARIAERKARQEQRFRNI